MIKTILQLIALSTLLIDLFLFTILIAFISEKISKKKLLTKIKNIFAPYSLTLAFLATLLATLGSLFLSEIAKLKPCTLCWYQRFIMYPQVVFLFIAMIRKNKILIPFLVILNTIGVILSTYHYLLQSFSSSITPCSSNALIPCDTVYNYYYGYITIPVMALTIFLLIITLLKFSQK